jgi:hypothetical protein
MEYEFTQKWTKEDYVAFATNHLLLNFLKTKNIILYTVSIGYLLMTPLIIERWEFFYVGIGLVVLFTGYLFMARKSAGKGYEKNKESLGIKFTLNDSGLIYETPEGIVTENWNQFINVKETEKHFFMYFAANKGFLIAKRDLSEDMNRMIRRGLREHVVNQKKIKLLG